MKKDEILRQSRKEKSDEREEYIENKSFTYGMITVIFISFILIAWKYFHDKPYWDISSIICSAIAVGTFSKYKEFKSNTYLIISIATTILTIGSLGIFFTSGF